MHLILIIACEMQYNWGSKLCNIEADTFIYFEGMASALKKNILQTTFLVLKALFLSNGNRFTRTKASGDFALNKKRSLSMKHITESNSTMQIIAWRDSQRSIKSCFWCHQSGSPQIFTWGNHFFLSKYGKKNELVSSKSQVIQWVILKTCKIAIR